ncbi:MAG: DUF4960 domain-containing protein [Bacteroidia bacterium]|nr:DUF4960 domain-containing protein [Bacteroidia bacterium]
MKLKALLIIFGIICLSSVICAQKINVFLLGNGGDRKKIPEVSSAYYFLTKDEGIHADYLAFSKLKANPDTLKKCDVLWFHSDDTAEFAGPAVDPEVLKIIQNYVSTGGKLLLSLDAMRYLVKLGIEPIAPSVRHVNLFDEGYGRKAGLHALRYHPAFKGLNEGSYIFVPNSDITCRQVGYFDDVVPQNGKVFAVDWSYIFLHENSKLALEYNYGKGKIIAIGAYMLFARDNANRKQLVMFTNNIFRYLASGAEEKKTSYWSYKIAQVKEQQNQRPVIARGKSVKWDENNDSPVLKENFATNTFWDLAGERMVVMGKEQGGIDEIWAHPVMAIRDYQAGIVFSGKDTIYKLNNQKPQIEVRPECVKRVYKFAKAYLTETITTSNDHPTTIIHYDYKGVSPAKIFIQFKSNLRLMWPYPETTTGNMNYGWDEGLNAFIISDESGNYASVAGSNKKPDFTVSGRYDDFRRNVTASGSGKKNIKEDSFTGSVTDKLQVGALAQFSLDMNETFDIVICASGEGVENTLKYYSQAIISPAAVYDDVKEYCRKIFNDKLMITSPDAEFNEGYRWALAGADRFFVNTPGVGKSLVAGYSTTEYGWDGGQKVNGRPGYAWYFGRDAEWSALALLDYGDFENVKNILENFINYQDLNGKIYHELTTSGVVHYDAADATPLFIILAGKYLSASGDISFIRNCWKSIQKAIDFCYSTDTDGDHLIENTNVGHGWEEGGVLFGCHTTLYLASLWAEALKQSSFMTQQTGMFLESSKYIAEAKVVDKIINTNFWNNKTNFLYHGLFIDGTYQEEKSIMPAVPMYFRQVDSDKTSGMLETFAGNTFSSDWGCRIISDKSPSFEPKGYHSGSVWPLFTGWAALAEYKNDRPVQGFTHIMNNFLLYKNWEKGYAEEVLNGSEYKPAGVCHHQCWSETMILQPVIEGLLGLETMAVKDSISLSPALPLDWDSLKVNNIRVGEHVLSFNVQRSDGKIKYHFEHVGNRPLMVSFSPVLPAVTKIKSFRITDALNWKELPELRNEQSVIPHYLINIMHNTDIEIMTEYEAGVIPVNPHPVPGYKSENPHIISEKYENDNAVLKLEGKSGTTYDIGFYLEGKSFKIITGGKEHGSKGNIHFISVDFPVDKEDYVTKILKLSF